MASNLPVSAFASCAYPSLRHDRLRFRTNSRPLRLLKPRTAGGLVRHGAPAQHQIRRGDQTAAYDRSRTAGCCDGIKTHLWPAGRDAGSPQARHITTSPPQSTSSLTLRRLRAIVSSCSSRQIVLWLGWTRGWSSRGPKACWALQKRGLARVISLRMLVFHLPFS